MFIPDPDLYSLPIPDPGSRDQKGTGSRIRNIDIPDPGPDFFPGSGSRRAKMTHKVEKKFVKVHVLKCWMASFES
jgi:hypothetical protein